MRKEDNYFRHNFISGFLHGVFYSFGMAFSNPETVIVTFLSLLGASKFFLGLAVSFIGSLGNLSGILPQLYTANFLETQKRKKPFLVLAIILRALCWGVLALLVFCLGGNRPHFLIIALIVAIGIFSFLGGAATVAFYDIWAKVIPSNLRGRFFAFRQLGGGVLAVGAGFLVKIILASRRFIFPSNYALLFFLTFIFISVSYLALGLVKEPEEKMVRPPLKFGVYLKRVMDILRGDSNLRRLIVVQALAGGGALVLPFYVLFGREKLGFDAAATGYFISAQMSAVILSNFFWGYISDFRGNKAVLQFSAFFCLLAPLTVLAAGFLGRWFLILGFFATGFCLTGRRIGNTNFLLDIAPALNRPTYIGLQGTLNFPIAVFPFLGGIILHNFGYQILFLLAAGLTGGGLLFSFKLRLPENREYNKKR